MAGVELQGVSKTFGTTAALRAVDLVVHDGEFLALLGPSGCGKTTLLRLVAGFESPDAGEIRLGDACVAAAGRALPPEARGIGMVFQSYALWPHMTVAGNVGFALRVRRMPAAERRRRVDDALALVGLTGLGDRRPHQLSGGQRQRVALARCLAMRPPLVLLDEPLAALDAHLRAAMQMELKKFHRELGVTFITVTHDQAEAMALADRIAVMDAGQVAQVATPQQLYRQPATAMVARFIGDGMLLPVSVRGRDGDHVIVDWLGMQVRARGAASPTGPRLLCLRPAGLRLSAGEGIPARVIAATFHGAATLVTVRPLAADDELRIECRSAPPAEGALVTLGVEDAWLLPAAHSGAAAD
jgi:iron(III) transport system ATP-binding protein